MIDTAAVGTIAMVAVRAFVAEVAELSSAQRGVRCRDCALLAVQRQHLVGARVLVDVAAPHAVDGRRPARSAGDSPSRLETPQRLAALPSH